MWQFALGFLCIIALFLISLLEVAYPVDAPASAPIASLVASGTLLILTTPIVVSVLVPA